jgi:hypothetical protein
LPKQYVNHLADLGLNLWRYAHVYTDLAELILSDQYYQVRQALDANGTSYPHFYTAVRQIASNLMKEQGPNVVAVPDGVERNWWKDQAVFEDTLAYCVGQALIRDRRVALLQAAAVSKTPCFRNGDALELVQNSAAPNGWGQ